MFQFPRLPPRSLWVRLRVTGHCPGRVPPFGHPRIEGRLRLPGDYRGLPRPSSASCAKASAARPYFLRFPLSWFPKRLRSIYRSISDGCISLCIAIADANPGAPSRGRGFKNSYQMMRTACTSQYTRCVYLDETLCSCQGARGSAPGAGCWKGRAGRARSPRSFKDCVSP